jgi:phosphoribosylformimino-5-aminoimidazole carboxamide ribotide isomerase
MIIFPAIDIKDGKCVRLVQGRADAQTVYSDDPAAMAQKWCALGAEYLHVVDLDGAFTGKAANTEAVRGIVAASSVPVQLGGGIRSMDDIRKKLDMGISRVILGTAALYDHALVKEAVACYPGRIVAGIDAKDGFVAVKGWIEKSAVTAVELGKTLKALGISACVFTDISRDGMLGGPSIDETKRMIGETGLEIIASGGIGGIDDLIACRDIGAAGAIIGKALYDGRIALEEALAKLNDSEEKL